MNKNVNGKNVEPGQGYCIPTLHFVDFFHILCKKKKTHNGNSRLEIVSVTAVEYFKVLAATLEQN